MNDFAVARDKMVDAQIRTADVTGHELIEALLAVPREDFVPPPLRPVAYLGENVPLAPGRVLLEPRSFAKLVDALAIGPEDLVLDLGTGLGYSAAVMARLAQAVVAVEEDEGLAREAEAALAEHAPDNTVLMRAPLAAGAPEQGPYDAVIIEGGIERLPDAIADQVKPGGRIAAIVMHGAYGQGQLGVKAAGGVSFRRIFDAAAPVLPGFATPKGFVF